MLSRLYILFDLHIVYIPVVIALAIQIVSNDSALTVLLLNVSIVFVFLSSSLNPPFTYGERMISEMKLKS